MIREVVIPVRPHPGQAEVHKHLARFKILSAGRRWGKTRLGVNECLDVAAKGGRAWWVAPSYKMSEVGWRPLRRMGQKIGAEVRKVDRQVILPNGGEVTVRSADDPQSLRGEGLDLVVMDEVAYIKELAWNEALRPALSDRQGKAIFISTPKGRNWFWRMWMRGTDEHVPDFKSWAFPTSTNPHIAPEEIEAARQSLPERIYAQEYEAKFLEDAGGVFRKVMAAATAEPQDTPTEGHSYIIGVDWGQMNDFTVLTVLDATTNEVVYLDRFNQIDYVIQADRLRALANRFHPDIVVAEVNSMGRPVIDSLMHSGLNVQPFETNNASKDQAVRALQNAFERSELRIIPDDILINELQAYESTRLPSGLMRYGAPEGMHDDTVMSLAIAWQMIANRPWYLA